MRSLVSVIMLYLTALCCSAEKLPDLGGYFYQHQLKVIAALSAYPDVHTQGIYINDGNVWSSSGGYGKSFLLNWQLADGTVLNKGALAPEYFAEGVTLFDDKLYLATLKENTIFVLDPKTFSELNKLNWNGPLWGLTANDEYLIFSDGSQTLRFVDPDTMTIAHSIDVEFIEHAVIGINEIEWINGRIWANVFQTDYILVVDPKDGRVEKRYDISALQPATNRSNELPDIANGIAYDKVQKKIYLTGKHWPVIYQVEEVDESN